MKRVVWREAKHVAPHHRSVRYARANGCRLEVTVWLRRPKPPRITPEERTIAVVERKRAEDGGWETVNTEHWPDASAMTVGEACAWCERAAGGATA